MRIPFFFLNKQLVFLVEWNIIRVLKPIDLKSTTIHFSLKEKDLGESINVFFKVKIFG